MGEAVLQSAAPPRRVPEGPARFFFGGHLRHMGFSQPAQIPSLDILKRRHTPRHLRASWPGVFARSLRLWRLPLGTRGRRVLMPPCPLSRTCPVRNTGVARTGWAHPHTSDPCRFPVTRTLRRFFGVLDPDTVSARFRPSTRVWRAIRFPPARTAPSMRPASTASSCRANP